VRLPAQQLLEHREGFPAHMDADRFSLE